MRMAESVPPPPPRFKGNESENTRVVSGNHAIKEKE
jgi:hypothetical protein